MDYGLSVPQYHVGVVFLTGTELVAASLTGGLALVIVLAYGLDAVGVPIAPC